MRARDPIDFVPELAMLAVFLAWKTSTPRRCFRRNRHQASLVD
jgi:hypothetical protein